MLEIILIVITFVSIGLLFWAISNEGEEKIIITELNRKAYLKNREKVLKRMKDSIKRGHVDCWVNVNFPQILWELSAKGYEIRQINNNLYEVRWV